MSIKLTLLSAVLSCHPSRPASPTTTKMLPDVKNIDSPLAIRIRLINRDPLLRRLVNKHWRAELHRYKLNHNKKVRLDQIYVRNDYVFVNRPRLNISAAERWEAGDYSKLTPKRHVTYHVLSVGPEYLKILHEGVQNHVSINGVALVTQAGDARTND